MWYYADKYGIMQRSVVVSIDALNNVEKCGIFQRNVVVCIEVRSSAEKCGSMQISLVLCYYWLLCREIWYYA